MSQKFLIIKRKNKLNEERYFVVDKNDESKTLADANGFGFKTEENAKKSYMFQYYLQIQEARTLHIHEKFSGYETFKQANNSFLDYLDNREQSLKNQGLYMGVDELKKAIYDFQLKDFPFSFTEFLRIRQDYKTSFYKF